MLWGITPDNWAQIWGGLLGSIPSAIIAAAVAAWVAVLVLNRSNEAQRKRDAIALKAQRKRDKVALDAQRTRDAELLKEQKEGLDLQLRAQSAEASIARERAALADIVMFVDDVYTALEADLAWAENEVNKAFRNLNGAAFRWSFEQDRDAWAREISVYPVLLSNLAIKRIDARRADPTTSEWVKEIADFASEYDLVARVWSRRSFDERDGYISNLRQMRKKAQSEYGIS